MWRQGSCFLSAPPSLPEIMASQRRRGRVPASECAQCLGFSVGGPDEESRESELAVSGRGTPLLLPGNIKHVSEQETVTSCCKKFQLQQ